MYAPLVRLNAGRSCQVFCIGLPSGNCMLDGVSSGKRGLGQAWELGCVSRDSDGG